MPMYQPSHKVIQTFLNSETRNGLSVPVAAIFLGILSQVETTIELTNRICDRYLRDGKRQSAGSFRPSAA